MKFIIHIVLLIPVLISAQNNWSIELDAGDNDLLFKYNGTTVFKLASSGAVTSADNITAFGTP